MSLAILFHFLCAQHVSDINISIIRYLEWYPCCRLQPATRIPLQPNHNNMVIVVIQQNSHKLLMMDILMSETC